MITYTGFTTITEIAVTEIDYDLFKVLVDAELMRHEWGNLYDAAFIALMGHKLTLRADGTERSPDNIKQFERNDEGFKVAYSEKDLGSTRYGAEYKRLLGLITTASPAGTENKAQFHSAPRPLIQPKKEIKF